MAQINFMLHVFLISDTMVVKWDEKPTKIHFYKYETENHEVDKMYIYRKIDMTIPGYIDTGCRVIRGTINV